jgi:predicted ATPase
MRLKTDKIVITGGPSSGKTTLINLLNSKGFNCFEEISRDIILEARKKGSEQLFLTHPLLFSELVLKGRQKQFIEAYNSNKEIAFFDRGTPDVIAYMDFVKETYPDNFNEACKKTPYDYVFLLRPWKAIYTQDNERYETFEQASKIHSFLVDSYTKFGYKLIHVPFDTAENRVNFILNCIKTN